MKGIIKIIIIRYVLSTFMLAGLITGIVTCENKYYGKTYLEYGDFKYSYSIAKGYEIEELTDSAKVKTHIIIPSMINGNKIEYVFKIESEKLETIYCESETYNILEIDCPNLKKIVILNVQDDYSHVFDLSSAMHENVIVGNGNEELPIFQKIDKYYYPAQYANTVFYLNYESNTETGIYWIDYFDWGEKIDFMPKNPTRDGYSFGGWYLEPECINTLDSDYFMPNEKADENGNVLFQQTSLYARWVK